MIQRKTGGCQGATRIREFKLCFPLTLAGKRVPQRGGQFYWRWAGFAWHIEIDHCTAGMCIELRGHNP